MFSRWKKSLDIEMRAMKESRLWDIFMELENQYFYKKTIPHSDIQDIIITLERLGRYE